MRLYAHIALLICAGLISGCASVRRIDSDVLTVVNNASAAAMPGTTYRFERLPSQVNNPEAGLAEQQAQAAMAAVGLVRDDAHAQMSVLVGFSGLSYTTDPWGRHGGSPWGSFGGVSVGRRGQAQVGLGMNMHMPAPTQYRREVSVLVRDLRSGSIVYETRASHEGPWADAPAIFATLFQAAMAQFPNPPAGMRKVFIDLPR